MDFPLTNLMDEEACYRTLVPLLHPDGLACPKCRSREGWGVHRRCRAPVIDYQCRCGCVFNAFTRTMLEKTRRRPSELILLIRGTAQGIPTAQLARELRRSRGPLLALRHRLQEHAAAALDHEALPDRVVEADEMYQNSGEKRRTASGSRRSATPPGQQHQRPRHVGKRPSAGTRRGGT